MWNFNSKSLTAKNVIDLMGEPKVMNRLFDEHKKVLETEVPSKLKAYDFAGPKNRLLFRRNQVNLSGEETSVINASYIGGYKKNDAYIATENPQSAEEAKALWESVILHGINIIVMLNKFEEDEKGYVYWHPEVGKSLKFGKLTVGTVKRWMILPTLQITKLVVVNEDGDCLSVYHFLYSNWQNRHILPPTEDFMDMMFKVRKYRENTVRFDGYYEELSPILVHCSNGLDRTMIFCTIDISISKYYRTKKVNIFTTARKLRQERFRNQEDTSVLELVPRKTT
ncbi:tyrosine-protein phosphatase non-receptor type 9-like [Cydia pomonella]|uniref:tyrosine-protein phosphatase non-receptor type 9-like n=1 Tax=Cydia pomonella TaxID=82600 RepID=UPI002ADE77EB|nr:tyrosine-protein phosphatase non-receptor type 9-like [Cydia pomonella]